MPLILTTSILLPMLVVALIVITTMTAIVVRFKQRNKKLIVKFTQKSLQSKSGTSPVYEEIAAISPPGSPSIMGTSQNVAYELAKPK